MVRDVLLKNVGAFPVSVRADVPAVMLEFWAKD